MNKEVEEIIQLGKDSILQLALRSIDERASIQNFAKVKIMTNGKDVFVSLRNPIKYLPIKSVFYFDVMISIIEKTSNYSPVSNGVVYNERDTIPFYKQTKGIKKNIQFVIKSINGSTVVGSIDTASFVDDMIIREYENYYDIIVVSEFQESSYKVEKTSGNIYDAEHSHLVPPPIENENKDIWREIN